MDLNLEFGTKNRFCHVLATKNAIEIEHSRAQCARLLVNCILSLLYHLYLLGELYKPGRSSQHKVVRSKPTNPRASWNGEKAFEPA